MFNVKRIALCVLVLLSSSACRRRAPHARYAGPQVYPAPPMPPPSVPLSTMPPPPMPRPQARYAESPRSTEMISVIYARAAPAHLAAEAWLTRDRPLEATAEMVSRLVALPRPITWRVEECDGLASWHAKSASLVICYRYFAFLEHEVEQEDIGPVFFFTVLHEVAHFLVSEFALPIVGGDEKAADFFAATLLLRNVQHTNHLLPTIRFFHRLSTLYKTSPWDDHPSDGQRYYDLLCLSWGAGAAHADGLVALLPQERRVRCRHEYVNAWTGWDRLLAPHSRVRGGETFWPR